MRRTSLLVAGLSLLAVHPVLAQTQTGLKLQSDQPINIESDKLEVRQEENIAIFSGAVNAVQGKTMLKAGKMIVHYAKNAAKNGSGSPTGAQQIELIEVSDKVYLKSDDQVATGDAGSFDMKANVMTLTGDEVVLTQGANVARGCKLTVHTQSGEAQLDGCAQGKSPRVQVQLPGSQSN